MTRALHAFESRLAPEARGMVAMIVAMMIFTFMDSGAKHLVEGHHTVQVVWARYMGQTVILAVIFAPRLRSLLRTRNPGIQLARSMTMFLATSLFFTSLNFMALAESVAVFEVAPLLITVLAALILKERVGPRRWTAVVLGLCGALIIIRPGLDVFQPAALLTLGAAACMAMFQIMTRMLGRGDSIWTTLIYTTGFGAVVASLAVPFFWTTPEGWDALIMAGFGGIGLVGHMCLVYALSQAPASTLAPFNYAGFCWALTFGFIIFGEVPDFWTMIGASIIVGAGIYVWHRERVRSRPAGAVAPRHVSAAGEDERRG